MPLRPLRRLLVALAVTGALVGSSVASVGAGIVDESTRGDGYAATPGIRGMRDHYVVRAGDGVTPSLRSDVTTAMEKIAAITGAALEWGPPATGPAGLGEITVSVGDDAPCPPGWGGCTAYSSVRDSADPADDDHLDAADVVIAPDIVGSGYQLGIVLHEMGHAMGLAHYDATFERRTQTMIANQLPGVRDYAPGDVAGLEAMARDGFLADSTPIGRLGAVHRSGDRIEVAGWAVDRDLGTGPARVLVTLDGVVAADVSAAGPGAAVDPPVAATLGTAHGFTAVVAAPPSPVTACVTVVDEVRGNGPVALGCSAV